MAAISCTLEVIYDHRILAVAFAIAIYPHVIDVTILWMILHYHSKGSLVYMYYSGVIKVVMELITYGSQMSFGNIYHPVGKSIDFKVNSVFLVALGLALKRKMIYIFSIDKRSYKRWSGNAVTHYISWTLSSCYCSIIVLGNVDMDMMFVYKECLGDY